MELENEIQQIRPFRNVCHKAAVNLLFTGKWIIQFHLELFKPYNLTLQQYNILRILKGKYPEPITVKLIRERMLDRMSDASRIVEVLRKKELVDRTIHPTDRRRVDVVITRKGVDLLEEIDRKENIRMDERMTNLQETELEQLISLLDKLRHRMKGFSV